MKAAKLAQGSEVVVWEGGVRFPTETNFVTFSCMANRGLKSSKRLLLFFVQCLMNSRFNGCFFYVPELLEKIGRCGERLLGTKISGCVKNERI